MGRLAQWVLVALLVLGGCGKTPRHAPFDAQPDDMGKWLTGSFTYTPPDGGPKTRLHIAQIWRHTKWVWLYAEWLAEGEPDKPLRQLVLLPVRHDDGRAGLEVHVLAPDVADAVAGAWHDPRRIADRTEDDLIPKPDCALLFERDGAQRLIGRTHAAACEGTGENVAYTRTRIELRAGQLVWCEQGFDENGKQVTGPPDAGHVYVKTVRGPYR